MWTKYSLIKGTVNLQIGAACFSSKIERLPRGGRLKVSALPSKSNLLSPLDKVVFILVGVGGQLAVADADWARMPVDSLNMTLA